MNEPKVYRLFITPQTHIRTSYNENWMMVKDDAYLLRTGMKKVIQEQAGKKKVGSANRYLNRRNTIRRYWDYKVALKALADGEKFEMPNSGAWIRFYMPMPRSWSKKKRNQKCFTLHEQTPDCDNMVKAFFDSILKKDQVISDFRASKVWYDSPTGNGFIEITLGELQPLLVGRIDVKERILR